MFKQIKVDAKFDCYIWLLQKVNIHLTLEIRIRIKILIPQFFQNAE